jgi:hypothetical protein
MCLSFTIGLGPRQRSHSQIRVPRDYDHNLLSQIRDFPNSESQVAMLKPQALGFLFVASYDSQVYGGGIRPRLHAGTLGFLLLVLLLLFRMIMSKSY